jgi:hypothetical protein
MSSLHVYLCPYLSPHHAAGLQSTCWQTAAVCGSLPARVHSQLQTRSKLRTHCQLRRPPAQGQQLPHPSCPAIAPSRRAYAGQRVMRRRALSGRALSRRPPCHRIMDRAVAPASHCGAQMVLLSSPASHSPAPRTLATLTLTPHTIAPRTVHPGLSPPHHAS